jgi:hypothetical protein
MNVCICMFARAYTQPPMHVRTHFSYWIVKYSLVVIVRFVEVHEIGNYKMQWVSRIRATRVTEERRDVIRKAE